ncbi:hypothetical protein FGE12_16730 [Aggregicoccus sp. 17bor-14]|uniref:helix-turn-helix domain-containing protein n=1 Tax=Myxococcaceae TaxID=31 RepID=UPI00129C9E14|nr:MULTISPECIES: helix-turn-helix domain-containing protein [Myxococcaceae]MBF5044046.1 helix-turn-helix domain-containing protein [Simulacricoccus sp. 17bor-14]MRI89797.1 hypothetical protein [Aggregicoccus sp. 17bor-14]
MKPFEQQTYYEILDLPPSASDAEIRDAHARALEMYAPDSVAVYALEDPSRLQALRARITEAMEMLTDADLRREYDTSLGLPPRELARAESLRAAAQGDLSAAAAAQPLARGAAGRLFARLSSPQPGFSISYVGLSPLPLLGDAAAPAPAESPRAAPAPEPVPPAARIEAPAPAEVAVEPAAAARNARPQDAAPVRGAADEPQASVPARPAEHAQTSAAADEPVRPAVAAERSAGRPAEASEPTPAAPATGEGGAPSSSESALALVPGRSGAARGEPRAAEARAAEPRAAEPRFDEPRPRAPELPPDTEFNGELLRRVRESRGFTLRVLADRTKIGTRHLENVEADRYDALPSPVYLRGILMSLARELGLDPLRVSKSYLALTSRPRGR